MPSFLSAPRAQALAWEQRLDTEAGPAVRGYSYHHLLQRPKLVIPMLAAGTPFYNRFLLSLVFSRVEETMRKWMKINEKTAEGSRHTLETLLTELAEAYRQNPLLAGDRFSRADLTAAALLAPLFQPHQYPAPWPGTIRAIGNRFGARPEWRKPTRRLAGNDSRHPALPCQTIHSLTSRPTGASWL